MTEKITLEIGYMGEAPLVTIYGDERGNEFPKWRLTGLDGWDAPIQRNRIVVADPNGGAYLDKFSTPLAKIITLNWSLFHVSNFAGWAALQEFNKLTLQDKLLTLKLTTEYTNEAIIVETLTNCYLVNDASLKKFAKEFRFTVSIGSKEYQLNTVITPLKAPTTPGTYHGESVQDTTTGSLWYWWSDRQSWETSDPKNEPGYTAGTTDKQELVTLYGTIYWNINISAYQSKDEFVASRGEYPMPPTAPTTAGTYHAESVQDVNTLDLWYWWSDRQLWSLSDPKNEPGYTAGTTDKQEFVTAYGTIYWNINISAYQSRDEFIASRGEDPAPPPPAPTTQGMYQGEPSTADNPEGAGLFWEGVSKTWVVNDPTLDPAYKEGTTAGQVGTESWNMGLTWESVSKKWANYPLDYSKLEWMDGELTYGSFLWTTYKTIRFRGYYDAQSNRLIWEDLKKRPTYFAGSTHGEAGTADWNTGLWWSVNPVTPAWVSYDPGPQLPPRDGSPGTYHGELRERYTYGDNYYWFSDGQYWSKTDPRTLSWYVAGTTDKQKLVTNDGTIYWNININAYQSNQEFFNSRGEYPGSLAESAGPYHGRPDGQGLYWNSMYQQWEIYDWTTEPGYYAGVDDGQPCWEPWAYYLYWNSRIGFYQTDSEYMNTNGYYPGQAPPA